MDSSKKVVPIKPGIKGNTADNRYLDTVRKMLDSATPSTNADCHNTLQVIMNKIDYLIERNVYLENIMAIDLYKKNLFKTFKLIHQF